MWRTIMIAPTHPGFLPPETHQTDYYTLLDDRETAFSIVESYLHEPAFILVGSHWVSLGLVGPRPGSLRLVQSPSRLFNLFFSDIIHYYMTGNMF